MGGTKVRDRAADVVANVMVETGLWSEAARQRGRGCEQNPGFRRNELLGTDDDRMVREGLAQLAMKVASRREGSGGQGIRERKSQRVLKSVNVEEMSLMRQSGVVSGS